MSCAQCPHCHEQEAAAALAEIAAALDAPLTPERRLEIAKHIRDLQISIHMSPSFDANGEALV